MNAAMKVDARIFKPVRVEAIYEFVYYLCISEYDFLKIKLLFFWIMSAFTGFFWLNNLLSNTTSTFLLDKRENFSFTQLICPKSMLIAHFRETNHTV